MTKANEACLLGDILSTWDHDTRYGRACGRGAITVGVVTCGDCRLGGYGPGVTPLFGAVEPVIEPEADSAAVLDLREDWAV